jgi:hypothetical protein
LLHGLINIPLLQITVSTEINIVMDPKPFSRRFLGDDQVVDLYCLQSRDID